MLLMYVKSRGGGMLVGCGSCMYVSMPCSLQIENSTRHIILITKNWVSIERGWTDKGGGGGGNGVIKGWGSFFLERVTSLCLCFRRVCDILMFAGKLGPEKNVSWFSGSWRNFHYNQVMTNIESIWDRFCCTNVIKNDEQSSQTQMLVEYQWMMIAIYFQLSFN